MEGARPWACLRLQVKRWICVSLGTGSPKPPSRQVPSCPAVEAAGMWAGSPPREGQRAQAFRPLWSGLHTGGAHDNMPGTSDVLLTWAECPPNVPGGQVTTGRGWLSGKPGEVDSTGPSKGRATAELDQKLSYGNSGKCQGA